MGLETYSPEQDLDLEDIEAVRDAVSSMGVVQIVVNNSGGPPGGALQSAEADEERENTRSDQANDQAGSLPARLTRSDLKNMARQILYSVVMWLYIKPTPGDFWTH